MMNVSSIKLHMYCPMKLYIKTHVDTSENEDYQLAVEIKKLMEKHYIGEKTMNDIKNELGIKSFRKMKAWYWILPTSETNEELKENTEE